MTNGFHYLVTTYLYILLSCRTAVPISVIVSCSQSGPYLSVLAILGPFEKAMCDQITEVPLLRLALHTIRLSGFSTHIIVVLTRTTKIAGAPAPDGSARASEQVWGARLCILLAAVTVTDHAPLSLISNSVSRLRLFCDLQKNNLLVTKNLEKKRILNSFLSKYCSYLKLNI